VQKEAERGYPNQEVAFGQQSASQKVTTVVIKCNGLYYCNRLAKKKGFIYIHVLELDTTTPAWEASADILE
jgi:hypothetical protein